MTVAGGQFESTRFATDGFFRSALEASPDCVLILDLAGGVQFVNRNGVVILGVRDEAALLGESWLNLWGEPEQARARAALEAAAVGETQRFTAPTTTRVGGGRHFDNIVSPLRDEAGPPVALLVTSRDVTDLEAGRLAAEVRERTVAQQAAVLRSASEMAKLAGWEIDFRRNILFQTEEGVRLLRGGPEHRVVPIDRGMDLYDPADLPRISALLRRARETGERVSYEVPMTRYDGSRGWIRVFGEAVYEDGACIGLRGAGMDISEEVAAREMILRAEQRLDLAVRLAGLEVYELDFRDRTLVRQGCETAIFEPALRYEDMWPDPTTRIDPRDRELARLEWAQARAARRPFHSEFRVLRPDGREVWVFCVAELTDGENGRPERLVLAIMDISARKRAEIETLRSMAKMREHETRQTLLLNELNHRVKNTLTAVQSIAVQTLTDAPAFEAARDLFIERLLALSSTHNLLVKHAWRGASLWELVETTLKPYGRAYACRGPDLRLDANFAVSLGMALHELATNALKHGAWKTAGSVSIEVTAAEGAAQIVWRESGGPPVAPPTRRGFGSRLLQRGVAAELGGVVNLDFAADGLVCTIRAPIDERLKPIGA